MPDLTAISNTLLKPCPFCGGKGHIEKIERKTKNGDTMFKVQCFVCKAQTHIFRFPEFAVSFWNQRAGAGKP